MLDEITKNKNKEFSDMTQMEKRVALAKDVLYALKTEKYIATSGVYLDGFDYDFASLKLLTDKSIQCEVCAIGSLFVSNMRKSKKLVLKKKYSKDDDDVIADDADAMIRSMRGIFNTRDLRTLEDFFECEEGWIDFDATKKRLSIYDIAKKWISEGERRVDSQIRLTDIMNNIIDNNGNFIVEGRVIV